MLRLTLKDQQLTALAGALGWRYNLHQLSPTTSSELDLEYTQTSSTLQKSRKLGNEHSVKEGPGSVNQNQWRAIDTFSVLRRVRSRLKSISNTKYLTIGSGIFAPKNPLPQHYQMISQSQFALSSDSQLPSVDAGGRGH